MKVQKRFMWKRTLLMLLAVLVLVPMARVEAKGNYKAQVYPAFLLREHPEKLPMTLSNGLVIDKALWSPEWEDSYLPVVKKNGKTVWTAKNQMAINPQGEVQFSVAENGDTIIVYQSGASGGSSANIAAIHGNGKVFLRKNFVSDDTDVRLLKPNRIEVAEERRNLDWDSSTQSNAERHSNIYDMRIFDIEPTGKLKLIKSWVQEG